MPGKLCPKIILEGTRLTFKTEIAFALNEHPRIVGPRQERLKVSGNLAQYEDLQPFIDDQGVMRRLVEESSLLTLELDVSDNDILGAADRIADWLEGTGGLWSR
jgi:hypothetical protein